MLSIMTRLFCFNDSKSLIALANTGHEGSFLTKVTETPQSPGLPAFSGLATRLTDMRVCSKHMAYELRGQYRSKDHDPQAKWNDLHLHGVVQSDIETMKSYPEPTEWGILTPPSNYGQDYSQVVNFRIEGIILGPKMAIDLLEALYKNKVWYGGVGLFVQSSQTKYCQCSQEIYQASDEMMITGLTGGYKTFMSMQQDNAQVNKLMHAVTDHVFPDGSWTSPTSVPDPPKPPADLVSKNKLVPTWPDLEALTKHLGETPGIELKEWQKNFLKTMYVQSPKSPTWPAVKTKGFIGGKIPPGDYTVGYDTDYESAKKASNLASAFSQQAKKLEVLIPDMRRLVDCPEPVCTEKLNHLNSTVTNMVMHLNDGHRWSREKVAKWMDMLEKQYGWSFAFPTPETIKKSGKPTLD